MQYKVVQSSLLYPEIKEEKNKIIILDTYKNLEWLLSHFKAEIKYNLMTRRREIFLPEQYVFSGDIENDSLHRIEYLATLNEMPLKQIDKHLDVIAGENPYHPIVECIKQKPWDGQSRLDQFIKTLETSDTDLTTNILRTWMVAAIAAAHSITGFINHGVLVLQGKQNIGKTRWVKSLDPINCNAVKESAFLDPNNKDSVAQLASYWIAELGELDSIFQKSAIGRLKSFITTEFDYVRLPYARRATKLERRTAYIATVNEESYLIDETGNRRWWTIPVTKIHLDHGLDMQQIWAEVYQLWREGHQTYLTENLQNQVNAKNKEHEKLDPLRDKLATLYDWGSSARRWISATSVLNEIGCSNPTRSDATKMGSLLKEFCTEPKIKTKHSNLHSVPHLLYRSNYNL